MKAAAEDVIVYSLDSYSSWQKGCVENTNKQIRKYIPRGTDFETLNDIMIQNIQDSLK